MKYIEYGEDMKTPELKVPVSFRIPKGLLARLQAQAEKEYRQLTNMFILTLEKGLEKLEDKK